MIWLINSRPKATINDGFEKIFLKSPEKVCFYCDQCGGEIDVDVTYKISDINDNPTDDVLTITLVADEGFTYATKDAVITENKDEIYIQSNAYWFLWVNRQWNSR